jgi:hypothetical protein
MRPIDLLLSGLCGSAFAVGFVFARAAWPEGRPLSITPTFARAVHFRFAVPREANRSEYDSAFVANLAGEESVIREKLVALLDDEQHTYSPSPSGVHRSERVVWSNRHGFRGNEVGSLQTTPVD